MYCYTILNPYILVIETSTNGCMPSKIQVDTIANLYDPRLEWGPVGGDDICINNLSCHLFYFKKWFDMANYLIVNEFSGIGKA